MAIGENDARASAIGLVAASGDDKAPAFFQALLDDAVKTSGDKVFVVKDGKAVDAATGAAVALPENAEDVVNSNRMRREIEAALASMKLLSTDVAQRAAAIKELREGVDEAKLPLIEKAYAAETDAKLKSISAFGIQHSSAIPKSSPGGFCETAHAGEARARTCRAS